MVRIDKPLAPSESAEQINLFKWAHFASGHYPELRLLYHIPNEGKRTRATGARMKAEGLKPGVPDLCLPAPRGKYHGLYIEMKAGRNTTTENQDEWLKALSGQGYATAVCWGWEQAMNVLVKYLEDKSYTTTEAK